MTNKASIQEVIVVEGKDDTVNLKRFYQVDTYETRGSAISEADLERLARLHALRGVIVLTDPDYNGERIRRIVTQAIPTVKHAFLNPDEAVPKSKTKGRSLGVEHASQEDLEKALAKVINPLEQATESDIKQSDLIRLKLLAATDSRQRREYLGQKLRIGYCNGKQLLKRLTLFGIGLREVETCMEEYEKEKI